MENLFSDNFFTREHLSPQVLNFINSEKNPTIYISYVSVCHVGKKSKKGVERVRQVVRINRSGKPFFTNLTEVHNLGKYSIRYSCNVDNRGKKTFKTNRKNVDAEDVDEFEETFEEKAGILPSDDFIFDIPNLPNLPNSNNSNNSEENNSNRENNSPEEDEKSNETNSRNNSRNSRNSKIEGKNGRNNDRNNSLETVNQNNNFSNNQHNINLDNSVSNSNHDLNNSKQNELIRARQNNRMRSKSPAPSEIRTPIKRSSRHHRIEPSVSNSSLRDSSKPSSKNSCNNSIKNTNISNGDQVLNSPDTSAEMIISTHADELECLKQVNDYRAQSGLKPLVFNQHLREISLPHTIAMFNKEVNVDHTNFKMRVEQLPECAKVGENVGYSNSNSNPIRKLMIGWIRSLHHRENIIGNYNCFGVSFVHAKNGDWYGTQLFGYILSKKMRDAVPIDNKSRKILYTLINDMRFENRKKSLTPNSKSEAALMKYCRRIACGKIEFGSGSAEERSHQIFGNKSRAYAEFSGKMLIGDQHFIKALFEKWKESIIDYILGDYTSVGIAVAKSPLNSYVYCLGFSKP
ncbi:hypothetical protein TRFO_39590 [Tritrichomonas foetus]|uniref:SCP domain-containing protein n=1 Tax=Tritrichomonas foetus TaxID=1144522 RepID=A0A1J4JA86_9EUKA|nr:hypothetical protein TRFO_39590 [Tritrichomonas foetus]|eukprot:OHS94172.1 hypothetical protein TRFO_39590 [Tritrichomonas foetus]